MDKAEELIDKAKKYIEEMEKITPDYHSGSKEDPCPLYFSFAIYNAFVEKGIVEEGDLVYSTYYGWCKLIYQKPLPEGKYIFNDNGTITYISESVNATQKKNKESMDKFLKGKFKERRY